jgi:hypothetical protein
MSCEKTDERDRGLVVARLGERAPKGKFWGMDLEAIPQSKATVFSGWPMVRGGAL